MQLQQPALPSKFASYFSDPDKMLLMLHELPHVVRKYIGYLGYVGVDMGGVMLILLLFLGSRDVSHVQVLLRQLKDIGLVQLEGDLLHGNVSLFESSTDVT